MDVSLVPLPLFPFLRLISITRYVPLRWVRSKLITRYLYTTMSDAGLEANIESSDFTAPMAGFGYVPLTPPLDMTTG